VGVDKMHKYCNNRDPWRSRGLFTEENGGVLVGMNDPISGLLCCRRAIDELDARN